MPQAIRDEYADTWNVPQSALVQTVTVGQASVAKSTNECGNVTANVVGKSADGTTSFGCTISAHWRMTNGILTVLALGTPLQAVPLGLNGLTIALVADNAPEGASVINVRLTTILNGPALNGATQINYFGTQT